MTQAPISDADRKAAWPIWQWLFSNKGVCDAVARRNFFDGDNDDHHVLQAFANHAAAAVAEERAKVVAIDAALQPWRDDATDGATGTLLEIDRLVSAFLKGRK